MRLFKDNTLVADIRPGKNYFVLWPLFEEEKTRNIMELKKKTLKLTKNIPVLCTTGNPIPYALVLKRDLTVREACYCLRNLMGFNLNLSLEEYDTEEERNDYRQEITKAFNKYLRGTCDWSSLCDATYCYDDDDMGPSIACHLYVIEYLIKKEII